jgi:hypothetical protein
MNERQQRERDFITLFCTSWYKNFPIAAGVEELGSRAVWTIHIGMVVKTCADFMGFFTLFESGRTDAVIEKATRDRKTWAKIEWEWSEPCSPTVNELNQLAKHAKGDVELLVYVGYSRNIHYKKNINAIKKAWQNIEKPLIAFLLTYHWEKKAREFEFLETHYFKAGRHRMVRKQPAFPWRVPGTVWYLLDNSADR